MLRKSTSKSLASVIIFAILMLVICASPAYFALGQANVATIVIQPSSGGSTEPAPDTYTYETGTNFTLRATAASGYEFRYWVVSGEATPGHETNVVPNLIIDPETGTILGNIPQPTLPSQIDSLTFSTNPVTITCGFGYTYTYQAVFAPVGAPTPSPSVAVIVIQPSSGGTTDPTPGEHSYSTGTNFTMRAIPNSGYEFRYWVASGEATPGHETNVVPNLIIDPETGTILGNIPQPTLPSPIDDLVFAKNPVTINCGYGYKYNYQPVFAQVNGPTASLTATPPASPTPTVSPTQSPSPSPTTTNGALSTEIIIAIAVIVILIIIAVAIYIMRKK